MVATIEKPPIRQRAFLTPGEFAAIVGVSERHVYDLAKSGQIASVRLGTKPIRIPMSEIDRLLKEARRNSD